MQKEPCYAQSIIKCARVCVRVCVYFLGEIEKWRALGNAPVFYLFVAHWSVSPFCPKLSLFKNVL